MPAGRDQFDARVSPVRDALAALVPPGSVEQTWLVGGIVRDALLGRALPDVDLVTAGDPEPVARAIARAMRGTAFAMGDRPDDELGCWRVTVPPGSDAGPAGVLQYDVCTLRGGSLKTDLAARDFCANAMAVPLAGPLEIIDRHDGMADITAGRVRMVLASAFDDDPLRMLRAARLAQVLGWEIDGATSSAISARAHRAGEPAGERTFTELRSLLLHPQVRRGWLRVEELGLAAVLLPELDRCRGVAQSRYHHLDVHQHTLAVLDNAEDLLAATDFWLPLPAEAGLVAEPFSEEQRVSVLLAALMHDLGKPGTRTVLDDGRISFAGHDSTGVAIVDAIAKRWRLAGSMRRDVGRLVATHLDLGYLLHGDQGVRERWRFRRAVRPVAAEAVILSVADRLATTGVADQRRWVRAHLELARTLWSDHWREHRDGIPVPLLDGRAIADAAGIEPGPRLGELVTALAEAQAVGDVSDVDAAASFVRATALSGSRAPAP